MPLPKSITVLKTTRPSYHVKVRRGISSKYSTTPCKTRPVLAEHNGNKISTILNHPAAAHSSKSSGFELHNQRSTDVKSVDQSQKYKSENINVQPYTVHKSKKVSPTARLIIV